MTNYDAGTEEGEEHGQCNNCAGVEKWWILDSWLSWNGSNDRHLLDSEAEFGIHNLGLDSWEQLWQ